MRSDFFRQSKESN